VAAARRAGKTFDPHCFAAYGVVVADAVVAVVAVVVAVAVAVGDLLTMLPPAAT